MKHMDGELEQVDKPWGGEYRFCINEIATVKILYIVTGEMTSYQHHSARDEWIQVIKGMVKVIYKEDDEPKEIILTDKNQPLLIKRLIDHRFEALADDPKDNGKELAWILEVSLGKYYDDDIIRLDDKYGRHVSKGNVDNTFIKQE